MTTPNHARFTPSPDFVCGHGRTLVLVATSADEELGYSITRCHKDVAGDDITLAVILVGTGSGLITQPDPSSGQPRLAETLTQPPTFDCRRITSRGEPAGSIVYGEELIRRISSSIGDGGYGLVYAPWPFDPDPQRAMLALAARDAVRRLPHDCVLVLYRIVEPGQTDQPSPRETDPLAAAQPTEMPKLEQEPAEELAADPALPPSSNFTGISLEFSLVPPSTLTLPLAGIARHWPDRPAGDDDAHPLVSVVIRSANRPELADALDSIALQTYPAIEVVIADVEGLLRLNPSPLCGRFPIKLASTGEHLARGTAANVGLMAASGVYAVFLDDDDWFLPDHISSLVSALQDHEGFCAAYAGIECRQRDEDGQWKFLHVFNSPHDPIRLLIQNYLPIHAVMFERRLFGPNLRFDESLH
ncbi:MAG TPA: glycosyltransferase family A protein, partial [Chromatiaceae bacterium]|nr:glycosyltransferase family A protein [Chromatiaceae bacterium]